MKKFELNVVNFDNEDVIATSAVIYTLTKPAARCTDDDGGANYWHITSLVDDSGNDFDFTGVTELEFDGTTYQISNCVPNGHTAQVSFKWTGGQIPNPALPSDGDYSYEDGVFTSVE